MNNTCILLSVQSFQKEIDFVCSQSYRFFSSNSFHFLSFVIWFGQNMLKILWRQFLLKASSFTSDLIVLHITSNTQNHSKALIEHCFCTDISDLDRFLHLVYRDWSFSFFFKRSFRYEKDDEMIVFENDWKTNRKTIVNDHFQKRLTTLLVYML